MQKSKPTNIDWEKKWDENYFRIMGTWDESKAGRMKALFVSLLSQQKTDLIQQVEEWTKNNCFDCGIREYKIEIVSTSELLSFLKQLK